MKRLLNKAIILALMALAWTSCSQDEVIVDYEPTTAQESESDIHISLNLSIPDAIQVTSRDVEELIENFTVLCFDKNDKALKMLSAPATTFEATGNEAGTLTVKIPNATRVMHVFANQSFVPFEKGMSEYADELINLVATSDKMVYWGRIEVPSNLTTSSAVKNWWANESKSISLLRNHAKVEVENENTDKFTLLGYTVVNTNAFGLAIPYYAKDDVYPYTKTFGVDDWIATDYIHAVTSNESVSGTDETMQTSGPIYVYETSAEIPASIIIKGYNNSDPDKTPKYWRVAFADEDGNQVDIRRNHHYTVKILGEILEGDTTFEEAVESTSTANSAWMSIAEEVTAVANTQYSLTIQNSTFVVVDGTKSVDFLFWTKQLGAKEGKLEVSWESGQPDALGNGNLSYRLENASEGKYKVTVPLARLDENVAKKEGKVVIKYGSGIQRKVKIVIIPMQSFEPVSYEPQNPGADNTAPIAELKFTIPESYPAEMFPFTVRLSTGDFTVRKVEGTSKDISLLFEGDGGYGEDNGIGYKFAYQVTAPGEHSVNLINNGVVQDYGYVTLEAEQFESSTIQIGLNRNN